MQPTVSLRSGSQGHHCVALVRFLRQCPPKRSSREEPVSDLLAIGAVVAKVLSLVGEEVPKGRRD
jgi:hypothetical protein